MTNKLLFEPIGFFRTVIIAKMLKKVIIANGGVEDVKKKIKNEHLRFFL